MIFYAIITKEKEWYVATAIPSGVTSQGRSIEEAKRNLKEALELYYEDKNIEPEYSTDAILTPLEIKTRHG